MLLQNLSRSTVSEILSETINKRCFFVPHVIYELPITAGDLNTLNALLKLQDDFVYKSKNYGEWFFAPQSLLVKYSKRSRSTIRRSRQKLKYLGLLDYQLGSRGKRKATMYRILIDPFYLVDRVQICPTPKQ